MLESAQCHPGHPHNNNKKTVTNRELTTGIVSVIGVLNIVLKIIVLTQLAEIIVCGFYLDCFSENIHRKDTNMFGGFLP